MKHESFDEYDGSAGQNERGRKASGTYVVDLAADSFIGKWPGWLRWVLFIPAAILGAVIVSTLVNILNGFVSDSHLALVWSQLISSVVLGAAFVYLAAYVAPKAQFEVGTVLLVVLAIAVGMIWVRNYDTGFYSKGTTEAYYALHSVLMVAGGIGALFSVKENLRP